MAKLADFLFDNPLGKLAAAGVALVVLIGSFAWQQRSIGASGAIAKVNSAGEKLGAKAIEARKPAFRDGAVERLRRNYCRDC